MKLLVKTSLYYLIFGIPVLLIAAVVGYFMLATAVKGNNHDLLKLRKKQIEKQLNKNDSTAFQSNIFYDEVIITPTTISGKTKNIYSDTLMVDPEDGDTDLKAMLTTIIKTKHGNYLVKIWLSTVDNDELVSTILTWLAIILVLIFIVFFYINWYVSRTLWKPFYRIVEVLNSFRSSDKEKPELQNSSITEFKELNNSVNGMMEKMMSDFNNQKQFTENASHEMQTPLAIIKNKIELLIQSENLSKAESEIISSVDNAADKLSRLNKSLLLLSKIENRQFNQEDNISLNEIIEESLIQFEDLIAEKNITVKKNIRESVTLRINPDLCMVLVNNLLQNAIRHNIQNGVIEINLNEKEFSISNSGLPLAVERNKIFERFQKNPASVESTGLGLSIAKEIAEASRLSLKYHFESEKHFFIISLI